MNPITFLKVSLPLIIIISVINLFLPEKIASIYTISVMLTSLFIVFILSLKVGLSYERELRKIFLYFAGFMLFVFLANIKQFWILIYTLFGESPSISLIIAILAYSMLIITCINILKITSSTYIKKKELFVVFIVFVFGIISIAHYFLNYKIELSYISLTYIAFRIIDSAIAIMLIWIVFIYQKYSKENEKESITFTIMLIGVIINIIGDYVLEIVFQMSYQDIKSEFQTGTIIDSIYIFSYLLIMVSLYAHLNYYKWTIKEICADGIKFKFD